MGWFPDQGLNSHLHSESKNPYHQATGELPLFILYSDFSFFWGGGVEGFQEGLEVNTFIYYV